MCWHLLPSTQHWQEQILYPFCGLKDSLILLCSSRLASNSCNLWTKVNWVIALWSKVPGRKIGPLGQYGTALALTPMCAAPVPAQELCSLGELVRHPRDSWLPWSSLALKDRIVEKLIFPIYVHMSVCAPVCLCCCVCVWINNVQCGLAAFEQYTW